jgi:hypothetical protein
MEDIIGIRARTIRGRSALHAVAGNLQEIALSAQPLDVVVAFEKPVAFSLNFDGTIAPVGFTGSVKTLEISGNARVERVVDRITSDTDLGATDTCVALKGSAIDVYRISGLMTAGLLGRRRKFVPTRWAITAVDDTLSTHLKKEIARYFPVEEIHLFSAEIFGNRIVCIPRRLEIRDDRDLGAAVALWRRKRRYRAGQGGHEKGGIFPDLRCILFSTARGL